MSVLEQAVNYINDNPNDWLGLTTENHLYNTYTNSTTLQQEANQILNTGDFTNGNNFRPYTSTIWNTTYEPNNDFVVTTGTYTLPNTTRWEQSNVYKTMIQMGLVTRKKLTKKPQFRELLFEEN